MKVYLLKDKNGNYAYVSKVDPGSYDFLMPIDEWTRINTWQLAYLFQSKKDAIYYKEILNKTWLYAPELMFRIVSRNI
jgi:hypothetical protein